ncbi:MAG TPA: ABC transporter permease [Gemmatimonadaceae bacterium]|jgi:putative ABC transport system permease protein
MGLWRSASRGLRRLFRPDLARRDLDDEVRDYFATAVESYIRAGYTPDEAARQVRMAFGTSTSARDEAAGGGWEIIIETLLRDFRYAIRTLRKSPAFAIVAILSLGIGIGATTTAYSVIDAFDFRPLPFRDADRLVWLSEITPRDDDMCHNCPWLTAGPTALDWIAQTRSFDGIAAVQTSYGFLWSHDDVVESLTADETTPNFFGLLGTQPLLGRAFVPSDTVTGALPVALVSYEFWQRHLGADPRVVGSKLLSPTDRAASVSQPFTVIGVLPRDFHFRNEAVVWLPLRLDAHASRANRQLEVVGRLQQGRSIAGARAELETISARLALSDPKDYRGRTATVKPLRDLLVVGTANGRFVLFAITMLVLLIAVLNVAGLLLGRAAARQTEFAMRTALGASRMQLVRQTLVEGSCIGIAGGCAGVLFALWAVRFVPRWLSTNDAGLTVGVDDRMLAFVAALSLFVGIAAAVIPAIRAASTNLNGALRTRADGGIHNARASNVLIAIQISLALVLLTAAGLLSRDFVELRYLDLGYDPYGLYSTTLLTAASPKGDPQEWARIAEATRNHLAALPGVVSVTLEHQSAIHPAIVRAAGANAASPSTTTPVLKAVDPSYFTTFGTRLLLGRQFSADDRRAALPVAIVNKTAARTLWPGRNAIGQQVFVGDSTNVGELLTVVGVADDAERGEMMSRHWPAVYRPFQQATIYHAAGSLHLRLSSDNASTLAAAEAIVRKETGTSTSPFESEQLSLGSRLLPKRFNAIALDLFACFGLLLAAMGIYGSVAYAVTQRTREIGIRIALGAQRGAVVGLVARRIVVLVGIGVFAGVASAIALTRTLQSFISTTSVTNPWIFVASVGLMLAVALIATLLPARRATRVDAVIALRGD